MSAISKSTGLNRRTTRLGPYDGAQSIVARIVGERRTRLSATVAT
jgi:hypothetical protein